MSKEILRELALLRQELGNRFDRLDKRLTGTAIRSKRTEKLVYVQQEQIDELKHRVEGLESIWENQSNTRYAVDPAEFEAAANNCGMDRLTALRALDQEGLLVRNPSERHMLNKVPIDGKPVRAVVMFGTKARNKACRTESCPNRAQCEAQWKNQQDANANKGARHSESTLDLLAKALL